MKFLNGLDRFIRLPVESEDGLPHAVSGKIKIDSIPTNHESIAHPP
jgi:hypothetical protein